MNNLRQPVTEGPSALVRAGLYVLVPVVGLLLLPILLLFIFLLYFLALFNGARVFVFSFTGKQPIIEEEPQGPHFLEIQAKSKALPDWTQLPPKG